MSHVIRSAFDVAADIFDPPGSHVWQPYPKQELATRLADTVDETLFGGAAGPGKTEWGIEYAIDQMERFPGNRGGIFRRVFPSLERTIIPRAKAKLVPTGRAAWNGQTHTFTFANGSILELASLQYADTVLDHQGAEYGFIFFEEITEFLQSQWEYMLGRLRAPTEGIRPRAIATTNPGGVGHLWVKRRWVKPKKEDIPVDSETPTPYHPWRPRPIDGVDDPAHPPGTRVFVPATHEDNPMLLVRDPGYLSRLRAQSDRGLRLAMEKGDWDAIDAVEGALWHMADIDGGRVAKAPAIIRRVLALDPSDGEETGDEFGVCVAAKGMNGNAYIEGSDGWKMSVRRMARAAINLYYQVHADAIVIERNHGGKWMIDVFRQIDQSVRIIEVWASHGKITRAEPVSHLFEHDPEAEYERRYRARMVGTHPQLEEELISYAGPPMPSPNRMDAMVWALTELMVGPVEIDVEGVYVDARNQGRR